MWIGPVALLIWLTCCCVIVRYWNRKFEAPSFDPKRINELEWQLGLSLTDYSAFGYKPPWDPIERRLEANDQWLALQKEQARDARVAEAWSEEDRAALDDLLIRSGPHTVQPMDTPYPVKVMGPSHQSSIQVLCSLCGNFWRIQQKGFIKRTHPCPRCGGYDWRSAEPSWSYKRRPDPKPDWD